MSWTSRKKRSPSVAAKTTLGLVLEGTTEYGMLPALLKRMGVAVVAPSVFHGQPVDSPVRTLVERRLIPHVRAQLLKATGRVIVVLDRETRSESAVEFAGEVTTELTRQLKKVEGASAAGRVVVAVADRRIENWLLADPEGIARSRLLRKGHGIVGKVACHADERNAPQLLQAILAKGWYDRPTHGLQLASHIRVVEPRMKYCSRSFVRFLNAVRSS